MAHLIVDQICNVLHDKLSAYKAQYEADPTIVVLSNEYYTILSEELQGLKSADVARKMSESFAGLPIIKTRISDIIQYF